MRYDIFFVRRDPGESFADALDATEDSNDSGSGPLTRAEKEQWDRILPRARRLLETVEDFSSDTSRELVDPSSGIQLTMISGEASITVTPVTPEQDAVALMHKVYALARVVEDETGLEGYDPQLEEPVSTPHEHVPASRTPTTGLEDDDDDAAPARSLDETSGSAAPAIPTPAGGLAGDRHWWEFWKP